MPYQVPQFIKEKTKLMGLITFTQLWILLSFGGLIILLFFILVPWLWLTLSVILAPVGFFIAFGKIYSLPVYSIITSAIRHFWLPKYYLWKKEKVFLETDKSLPKETKFPPKTIARKNLDENTLKQLTELLDK